MSDLKLFNYCLVQEDLRNPVNRSVVDVLTDRKESCEVDIAIEPATAAERRLNESGRILTATLAINYGPHGNLGSMYYVFLKSPEAVSGEGNVFVLDNSSDNKTFLSVSARLRTSWMRESDKVRKKYILVGNVGDVFDGFRAYGFNFSQELMGMDDSSREGRIVSRLKENGIYNSRLNT